MNAPAAHWRPLAALTLPVLAAHAWLLSAAPMSVQMPDPFATRTLVTRTIVMAAPAPTAQAAPPPAAPRPAARTVHAPSPVATPMPAPSPAAEAAVPAPSPTAAPPAPAAPTPPATTTASVPLAIAGSVKLHYKVTAFTRNQLWDVRSELHWRHDGASYDAKLELSAPLFPTRTERSQGEITADGLAPTRYSSRVRNEEAAHFERDKGKVTFSSNRPDAPLTAGAQDRLSVMLQLGALIGGAPARFPPGTAISVQTAGPRDAETWVFTVEGEESLQLPGGPVAALRIVRNPRKEFDQKIELWLAPGMDYVPVRLRLTQPNGDWVDQQWWSTDKG